MKLFFLSGRSIVCLCSLLQPHAGRPVSLQTRRGQHNQIVNCKCARKEKRKYKNVNKIKQKQPGTLIGSVMTPWSYISLETHTTPALSLCLCPCSFLLFPRTPPPYLNPAANPSIFLLLISSFIFSLSTEYTPPSISHFARFLCHCQRSFTPLAST